MSYVRYASKARSLQDFFPISLAGATRLLGAEMVLVGIRPEMAQVLVTLGDRFGQIPTAGTLQSGLAMR